VVEQSCILLHSLLDLQSFLVVLLQNLNIFTISESIALDNVPTRTTSGFSRATHVDADVLSTGSFAAQN